MSSCPLSHVCVPLSPSRSSWDGHSFVAFLYAVFFLDLAVAVVVAPLGKSNKLLHHQEDDYSGKNPQTHHHVLGVVVGVVMGVVFMFVIMVMMIMSVIMFMFVMVMMVIMGVVMRGYGMRDEMEKGVAQQPARRKAKQDLQEGRVFRGVSDGYAAEDEERCGTDEGRGREGVDPHLPGALKRPRELFQHLPSTSAVVAVSRGEGWEIVEDSEE